MTLKTSVWNPSEYLETEEEIVAYLNAALEEGDPALLQVALGDIAKARGMSAIASEVGVGRESLYKSLSAEGNPSWQTLSKVVSALGLTFEVKAKTSVAT